MRDCNNERWNEWCMQNVSYQNVQDKWDGTSVGYLQIGVSEALRSYDHNSISPLRPSPRGSSRACWILLTCWVWNFFLSSNHHITQWLPLQLPRKCRRLKPCALEVFTLPPPIRADSARTLGQSLDSPRTVLGLCSDFFGWESCQTGQPVRAESLDSPRTVRASERSPSGPELGLS